MPTVCQMSSEPGKLPRLTVEEMATEVAEIIARLFYELDVKAAGGENCGAWTEADEAVRYFYVQDAATIVGLRLLQGREDAARAQYFQRES